MKFGFYPRLAVCLVGVFMVVMIACFYSTNLLQKRTQQEAEQKLHIGLAEHLVSDNPLLKEGVYDYEALGNRCWLIFKLPDTIFCFRKAIAFRETCVKHFRLKDLL